MVEPSTKTPVISRRKFLNIAAISTGLGAAYYFGVHSRRPKGYTLKHSKTMMGTIVNFTIIGIDQQSCREALEKTIKHMEKLGAVLSRHDQNSPLSKLNREGKLLNPDPSLVKVIALAQEMSKLTDGAFDPTVLPLLALYKRVKTRNLPQQDEIDKALTLVDYRKVRVENDTISYDIAGMGMTLDGIGKGYIVDEAVKVMNDLGFANVCIEAGGDLMVTGAKQSGAPWTIAIRNPRPEEGGKQFIIKMKNRAIATSGDYMQAFTEDRRFHHIINPATGFSPPELASCSILAPTVARADGLATSAMVMGPTKSLALLESLPGSEGFLIGKDLTTYNTEGFFG
jgi:thiamine biosynthesis lipoprotein